MNPLLLAEMRDPRTEPTPADTRTASTLRPVCRVSISAGPTSSGTRTTNSVHLANTPNRELPAIFSLLSVTCKLRFYPAVFELDRANPHAQGGLHIASGPDNLIQARVYLYVLYRGLHVPGKVFSYLGHGPVGPSINWNALH